MSGSFNCGFKSLGLTFFRQLKPLFSHVAWNNSGCTAQLRGTGAVSEIERYEYVVFSKSGGASVAGPTVLVRLPELTKSIRT